MDFTVKWVQIKGVIILGLLELYLPIRKEVPIRQNFGGDVVRPVDLHNAVGEGAVDVELASGGVDGGICRLGSGGKAHPGVGQGQTAQNGGQLRPGDTLLGVESAVGIGAGEHTGVIESEDLLAVWGGTVHVGEGGNGVDGGVGVLRQGTAQQACQLRPGGRTGVAVELPLGENPQLGRLGYSAVIPVVPLLGDHAPSAAVQVGETDGHGHGFGHREGTGGGEGVSASARHEAQSIALGDIGLAPVLGHIGKDHRITDLRKTSAQSGAGQQGQGEDQTSAGENDTSFHETSLQFCHFYPTGVILLRRLFQRVPGFAGRPWRP